MPLHNLGLVGPSIYRSAQPDLGDLPVLRALSVTVVLKLNTREEAPAVELAPGIVLWEVPLGLRAPDDATTRQMVAQLHAFVGAETVLVHCTHGRDRTGFVAAAYQILQLGWSLEAALADRARFGVNTPWAQLANQSFTEALERLAGRST